MKLKIVTTTNFHRSVNFVGSFQLMPAVCSTDSILLCMK